MARSLGSFLFAASLRKEGHCTPRRDWGGVYIHPKESRFFTRQPIVAFLPPFSEPRKNVVSSSSSTSSFSSARMASDFNSGVLEPVSRDLSSSFSLRRFLHSSFPLSYLVQSSSSSSSRNEVQSKLSSSFSIRRVSSMSPRTSSSSPPASASACVSSSSIQEEEEERRRLSREKREKSTPASTSFDFARIYSRPSTPSSSSSLPPREKGEKSFFFSSSSSSSPASLEQTDAADEAPYPENEREDLSALNQEKWRTDGAQLEAKDLSESLGKRKDRVEEERRSQSEEKKGGLRKKKRSSISHPPLLTVTPAASRRIAEIVKAYNRDVERKSLERKKTRERSLQSGSHHNIHRKDLEEEFDDEEEEEELMLCTNEEEAQGRNGARGEGEKNRREMKKNEENQLREEEEDSLQPRAVGIRIGLEKRGCSGLSYTIDVVTESTDGSLSSSSSLSKKTPGASKKNWRGDERIETPGGSVLIASDAVMFLVGTEIDFVDTELERKFVFRNPNEKYSCGCGKSFMT